MNQQQNGQFNGINISNVISGHDKKNRQKVQFYLSQEDAAKLVEQVQAQAGNPKGVKIAVHLQSKQFNKQDGSSFTKKTGFAYAQAVGANQQGQQQQNNGHYRPKNYNQQQQQVQQQAANTLNTQVQQDDEIPF